jgi:HEPN domain-containing protein
MPFFDFWDRVELIQEFRKEEIKSRMIAATWNAWLMGVAPGKSFEWLLYRYELAEKPPPLTPEERREIAERAYKTAAEVIELDRKRKERQP